MIGLLFFGVLILWAIIAITLGLKLPKWLRIQRFTMLWIIVISVLIFFAPVADEIIAWSQMNKLCKSVTGFQFAAGVDEKVAYGRTVYYEQSTQRFVIFPSSVSVIQAEYRYVDATTKQVIFFEYDYEAKYAWLGIPAGSSGNKMTALLKGCRTDLKTHLEKIKTQFDQLHITQIPTP